MKPSNSFKKRYLVISTVVLISIGAILMNFFHISKSNDIFIIYDGIIAVIDLLITAASLFSIILLIQLRLMKI